MFYLWQMENQMNDMIKLRKSFSKNEFISVVVMWSKNLTWKPLQLQILAEKFNWIAKLKRKQEKNCRKMKSQVMTRWPCDIQIFRKHRQPCNKKSLGLKVTAFSVLKFIQESYDGLKFSTFLRYLVRSKWFYYFHFWS